MRMVVGEEWVSKSQIDSVRVYLQKNRVEPQGSEVMSQHQLIVSGYWIPAKGNT